MPTKPQCRLKTLDNIVILPEYDTSETRQLMQIFANFKVT